MKAVAFYFWIFLFLFLSSCTTRKIEDTPTSKSENIVVAHRGAWKQKKLPQNSLASLNHAVKLNCYAIEFDVHLTKDDVLVVNHNHDFYGISIESSTYKELLAKKHPNGESIPTLTEFLKEGMKQKKSKLICELKPSWISKERTLEAATAIVNLVTELGAENWIEYISFDYDATKKFVELAPNAKVAYLTGDIEPSQLYEDGLMGLDYTIEVYKKHPHWIKRAKDLGLTVNVWTVNTKKDMLYFINEDVDFITTDEPSLLFRIIKNTEK